MRVKALGLRHMYMHMHIFRVRQGSVYISASFSSLLEALCVGSGISAAHKSEADTAQEATVGRAAACNVNAQAA